MADEIPPDEEPTTQEGVPEPTSDAQEAGPAVEGSPPQVELLAVVGTGTPPTSPVFGVPRYSANDAADFPTQGNAITDTFDALAVRTDDARLSDMRTPLDGSVTLAKLVATLAQAIPQPGDLKVTAQPNAPAGWLLCDGSAISRTTYAALFNAIGTTYGAGDGSTTFGIPDYRGRTIVGAGAGTGLTSRALGTNGGEETHLLANGEMPTHSHGGQSGLTSTDHWHNLNANTSTESAGHTHGVYSTATFGFTPGGTQTSPIAMGGSTGGNSTGGESASHVHNLNANTNWASQNGTATNQNHQHAINNDGGGTSHNNMQPFEVANVVIKT
jgi:microcystin-dependent protein